jgi:2-methylcitrate dehydratase
VPLGHRKRRAEGMPVLIRKFESSIAEFPAGQDGKITALFTDRKQLEAMPVHEFVATMVKNS